MPTGRDFIFGHTEIARLFLRIGEGMILRAASAELRRSIFRVRPPDPAAAPFGWPDETSRRANLAVNYLDAFAPVVIAALHPRGRRRQVVRTRSVVEKAETAVGAAAVARAAYFDTAIGDLVA